jgi:hypothetical protein
MGASPEPREGPPVGGAVRGKFGERWPVTVPGGTGTRFRPCVEN